MTATGTNRGPAGGTSPPRGGAGTPAWELLAGLAGVTRAAPRRRGRALQALLRQAVREGRLAAGTRLPASRELATDLGVSRGLVTRAYEQLTAEGYLRSGRGAGTWVADAARSPGGEGPAAARGRARPAGPARAPAADFRPGTPDLSLFPRSAWAAAHRRALAGLAHADLGYPDPRGLPALREALAALLARRRGVVADPERVVVVSGVAQALTLLGGVLRGPGTGPGRPVAVEAPGSPEHEALFAAAGLAVARVPVDARGLDPARLVRSGARAAVVTPAHQFPSGIVYGAARRRELLAWARAADGLLIEDDYDGDFRFDRAPVGALQGLDPQRVAYAGSVSKSLAPGLRLGWLVVPERLLEEVMARKRMMDLGHPVLDQALFADFLAEGAYDRQLRRCQRAYRERRDALVAALAAHCPGASVTGVAAGLHAIVTLPARCGPPARFLERAAAAGVAVRPLEDYGAKPPPDGRVRLVLGYAHLAPGRLRDGVRLLARAAGYAAGQGRGAGPGRAPGTGAGGPRSATKSAKRVFGE
ncbi:PLP-dependent aminotransferase family protein [Streptomyces sp. DSM 44917]|uniref:PLP-dependent aminotransferase family protein n=1 Tax=Streptomyces boetiae TaxID=3075541 RepID=A0ABU2LHJ0_9ACTN|nr:PLP-dependent aminotransferase family protein [Streptomyces sp. DSM 44917]MDT0310613.1 PLP-dependent aminotransferase family protein [Streptomyces sp. DSM 44917]